MQEEEGAEEDEEEEVIVDGTTVKIMFWKETLSAGASMNEYVSEFG